eukprot:g34668.t1
MELEEHSRPDNIRGTGKFQIGTLLQKWVLYKTVSEPPLGLTDVEEAMSGAADTVAQVDRCAGEPQSDVKGVECPILGTDMAEADELGVGDRILAGGKWEELKEKLFR